MWWTRTYALLGKPGDDLELDATSLYDLTLPENDHCADPYHPGEAIEIPEGKALTAEKLTVSGKPSTLQSL